MKKLTIVLIIVAVLCCSFAFVGCKNLKYSETFAGAISKTTYESKEDAVKGFLEEEISGMAFTAEYVGYTKTSDLSQKEIDGLAIDEDFRKGIVSVEKGEVEYIEKEDEEIEYDNDNLYSFTKLSNDSKVAKKRVVYIVSYTAIFRFFVPANSNGETLSASYFDSTFDATKYLNCTMEAQIETLVDGSYSKQTASCKITENGIYEYDKITDNMDGSESYLPRVESYGVYSDGALYWVSRTISYMEYGGNAPTWNESKWNVSLPNEDITISEYFIDWFKERFNSLDHSYFEKSATGYKLRADLFNEFIKDATAEELEDFNDFELEYTINIADGRMSDVTIKIAYEDNGETFSTTMKIKFSKFGKTTLDVPEEINQAIQDKKDRWDDLMDYLRN